MISDKHMAAAGRLHRAGLLATGATYARVAEVLADCFPAKAKKGGDPLGISWSFARGWVGISDAIMAGWSTAYPACNIEGQLARMNAWLAANPAKAKKSNWAKFITAWLQKEQQRGGDAASNKPANNKPLSAFEIQTRLEAAREELRGLRHPGGCAYPVELTGKDKERAAYLFDVIAKLKNELTRFPQ